MEISFVSLRAILTGLLEASEKSIYWWSCRIAHLIICQSFRRFCWWKILYFVLSLLYSIAKIHKTSSHQKYHEWNGLKNSTNCIAGNFQQRPCHHQRTLMSHVFVFLFFGPWDKQSLQKTARKGDFSSFLVFESRTRKSYWLKDLGPFK